MCRVVETAYKPRPIECAFMLECPCEDPRELVEIWPAGQRQHTAIRYSVAYVRRHMPALWASIRAPYRVWQMSQGMSCEATKSLASH